MQASMPARLDYTVSRRPHSVPRTALRPAAKAARLALVAMGFAALPALAEQIVLYERSNFSGRNVSIERNVQNLAYLGFENRASSVYVMSGDWEFCTEPYFQGSCRVYRPGEYRTLGNQSNRISSVRLLSGNPGSGSGGNQDGGWNNSGGALVELFDGQNFQGRLGALRGPTPSFDPLGFNDRVASLIVRRGTWEFCTDANYRNNCRVYGPGEYPQIWGGQDDQYSSARPVNGGWNGPGNNRPGSNRPGDNGWGGNGGAPRVRFFEYSSFQGRSIWVRDPVASFDQINFNDKAESMIIEGGSWRLCSDAHGQGYCQVFGPGQYPVLPSGLRNSISSAYPR